MRSKVILAVCLLIITLPLVTACGKKAAPTVSTPTGKSAQEQAAIIEKFNIFIKTNPNEKDVISFVKREVPSLSKENATTIVLGLEDYHLQKIDEDSKYYMQENKGKYTPIISEDVQKLISQEINNESANWVENLKNGNIKDPKLKEEFEDIKNRGYKIILPEGMVNVIIDYEKYKEFNNYVTDDYKEYIKIKAEESNNPTSEDAAIMITIDELFNRTLACENFIKSYPNSKRLSSVKTMYKNYTREYFYGENNTPAYDYSTNKLKKEFQDSYAKAMLLSIDSNFTRAVGDYMQVVKENDYVGNKEAGNKIAEIIERLGSELGLD